MYVCIPKMQPPFEGGTNGDALPPDFDMATRRDEFKSWCQSNSFTKCIEPALHAMNWHIQESGCDVSSGVNMVGFCWGSWAVCKGIVDGGIRVDRAALVHPSVGLEAAFFDGDVMHLMNNITSKCLVMPAGNDPDDYRDGGSFLVALQTANSDSQALADPFKDEKHGFAIRGDITNDATKIAMEVCHDAIRDLFK